MKNLNNKESNLKSEIPLLTPEELFKVIDLWVKENPKESNVLFKALEYKKNKILKNPCNHDKSEISSFVYNNLSGENSLKIKQQIKTCASCSLQYQEECIDKTYKEVISKRSFFRKIQLFISNSIKRVL